MTSTSDQPRLGRGGYPLAELRRPPQAATSSCQTPQGSTEGSTGPGTQRPGARCRGEGGRCGRRTGAQPEAGRPGRRRCRPRRVGREGGGMERLRKLWRGRTMTFGVPLLLYLVGGSFGLREFAQIRYDVHKLHGKVDPALKEKLKQNTVTLESEYEVTLEEYTGGC
ncbi:cytochrome c oxidase assembly protein COX16 homolog, mitochondrial isoform 3-T4 [Alca torda]